MKMSKLAIAMGLALGVSAGANAVQVAFPDGKIEVTAFDWGPTSFLAKGGNTAIGTFAATGGAGCGGGACDFDVYTQARLIGTLNGPPNTPAGLNKTFEVTMVAKFTETVTGVFASNTIATFKTSAAGKGNFVEIYLDVAGCNGTSCNSHDLTGFGFNDGKLVLRGTGSDPASGLFTVTDATPVDLDGATTPNGNDYAGQKSVTGTGSNTSSSVSGLTFDQSFFISSLKSFGISFSNISIGIPYTSVDAADCFDTAGAADGGGSTAIGSIHAAHSCADTHVNGLMSANDPGVGNSATGYVGKIGLVNGILGNPLAPDFIAQTDYNSPIQGVPEPGTLALLGLGLSALGLGRFGRREKKAS